MTCALREHPLWLRLDRSSRYLLETMAQAVTWSDTPALAHLAQDSVVLGWTLDGQPLTLPAAQQRDGAAPSPLPAGSGSGWLIPGAALRALLQDQDACRAYLEHTHADSSKPAAPAPSKAADSTFALSAREVWGWLLALGLPVLAMLVLGGRSDTLAQWLLFLSAISAGLCVWVLGLAPPFVGALLALLLMMAVSRLPPAQALAGFGSGSFFLLLGMFGISAAVQHSGLMQRLLSLLLRRFSHTTRMLQACLVLVGAVMTLFIPSTAGRLQLMAPMVKVLAHPGNSAVLALAALSGSTLFSTAFLLGNPANFIVLGILPEHWQPHVNWLTWFQCAAVYTLVMGVCLALGIVGRSGQPTQDTVAGTWKPAALPRFSSAEAITAVALACLTLGVALGNVHHIETAWLALFVLLLLVATGVLSIDRWHTDIHWPILIYLLCTVGFARSFSHMGIQEWITGHLGLLEQLMREAQVYFLLLLAATVVLLRLVLPALVCITTLCAVLLPLADTHGMNPLVVGFVVLTASEIWFFPHQSTDYVLFRESLHLPESQGAGMLRRNARIQACRVLALAVSIPYWYHLGYLQ